MLSRQSPRFAGGQHNSRLDQSQRNHQLISNDTFAQQLASNNDRVEPVMLMVNENGRLIIEETGEEEHKETRDIVNSKGELLRPDSSIAEYPSNYP